MMLGVVPFALPNAMAGLPFTFMFAVGVEAGLGVGSRSGRTVVKGRGAGDTLPFVLESPGDLLTVRANSNPTPSGGGPGPALTLEELEPGAEPGTVALKSLNSASPDSRLSIEGKVASISSIEGKSDLNLSTVSERESEDLDGRAFGGVDSVDSLS